MTKVYNFDINFTCRHEECESQFKNDAVYEVQKLSKYHNHIIDGDIIIDNQHSSYKAEIVLRVPGHTFVSHREDFKLDKAFDSALDKMKAQLLKLKSKNTNHRPPHENEVEDVIIEETNEEMEDSL